MSTTRSIVKTVSSAQVTATYTFPTSASAQQQTYTPQADGSIESLNQAFVWALNPDGTLHGELFLGGSKAGDIVATRCAP